MRLWKDPNTRDCIRNRAGARDDVAEEHRNGTWKKTLERSVHGYEGLATEEEVVKVDAAEVGMANDFNRVCRRRTRRSSGRRGPRSCLMSSCCRRNSNAEPKRRPDEGNCGKKRRRVPQKTHGGRRSRAVAGLARLLRGTEKPGPHAGFR